MSQLKTISVRLSERQRIALAQMAAEQEREQSFIIRKAVDALIAANPGSRPALKRRSVNPQPN